ncbi:MAG: DUF4251 domain-containing protein [Tannerella sp.]|jgi:hypothetical protein|nr:DUF4251 domain-containing protein [Tannerella sp.]
MKTMYSYLTGTMLALAAAAGLTTCALSRTVRDEQASAVRQQIESRRYKISVNRMLPGRGASQYLSSSYSLTVKGDTIISYLPFIGQAYSLPYGGGKGLNFESTITVYAVTFNARGTAQISLQTRSENDVLRYHIEIFDNGTSSIRVTSNNRQSISFYGRLEKEMPPGAISI